MSKEEGIPVGARAQPNPLTPFPVRDRAKTPENRQIACAFVIYYLLKLSAMGTQRALFEFSHGLLGQGASGIGRSAVVSRVLFPFEVKKPASAGYFHLERVENIPVGARAQPNPLTPFPVMARGNKQ